MLGAIAGDIIGSAYEPAPTKNYNFQIGIPGSRFTDDTVLTVAVADTILNRTGYGESLKTYYRLYPHAGYGQSFIQWARSGSMDGYGSWGNGSAMRVSPVGFAFDTLDQVLDQAECSSRVSHNHPEGIKGAQATAAAVFLARKKTPRPDIQSFIESRFGYDLSQSVESIRSWYAVDVSCQGSVPQAIRAFLESSDYEDAIRRAISLGGDSDTLGAITGGIAEAWYAHIPGPILALAAGQLDARLMGVVRAFYERFMPVSFQDFFQTLSGPASPDKRLNP
ncbi:MAG: ADP-ribosylglycohydrolase family protein [Pseudomonadota bacterium]